MSGTGSAEEENYWPGYVDALTTMTMVLTFIMMVLGVVIFSMSQNVSKSILESVASAANVAMPKSGNVDELRAKVVEALKKSREAPATSVEATQQAALRAPAVPPPPTPPVATAAPTQPAPRPLERRIETASVLPDGPRIEGVQVSRASAVLTLAFKKRGILLDEPAKVELNQAIDAVGAEDGARTFDVRGYSDAGVGAVTEARRVAFYRAMLVRSQLIENGIAAGRITVRIEDGKASDGDIVRVFIGS